MFKILAISSEVLALMRNALFDVDIKFLHLIKNGEGNGEREREKSLLQSI